jgi:two-component system sensor histidine kinase CpxA
LSSLYTRVLVSFWAVMLLIVAGAVGVTWLVLVERGDEMPRVSADLMQGAALALRDGGEDGLREWLRATRARRPGVRVLIVDPDGHDLLGRPLPPWLEHGPASGASEPPPPGILPARPLPQLVDDAGRHYGVAMLPPRHELGPFELPETRLAVLILAFATTFVVSWLLTRSITRPVRALGAATRALAQGDLAVQLDPAVSRRRDELGTLGRDFDTMALRLRDLLQGREQLLRDVSHELRSPLARMRVALGLARQPGSDVGRQIERIELEIERLDRLIGQVLHLSRLDAKAGTATAESVDLVELIDGIARDAAFEAQPRAIRIAWQPPTSAHLVRGDAALLASAVENVVRNAVNYTADGSEVRLSLAREGERERIVVRDQGPGVPEHELARIFEPFHRVAESRTRDSGGDGIGLAITARVLAAHGGAATAQNVAGGGLELALVLPRGGAA